MEVGNSGSLTRSTGSVAELNVRELLSRLLHKGFMTERIGKYNLAALIFSKVNSGIVALAVFAYAGNYNYLIVFKTHTLLNRL